MAAGDPERIKYRRLPYGAGLPAEGELQWLGQREPRGSNVGADRCFRNDLYGRNELWVEALRFVSLRIQDDLLAPLRGPGGADRAIRRVFANRVTVRRGRKNAQRTQERGE